MDEVVIPLLHNQLVERFHHHINDQEQISREDYTYEAGKKMSVWVTDNNV